MVNRYIATRAAQGLFILLLFVFSLMSSQSASALDQDYFDNADLNTSNRIEFNVGQTSYVQKTAVNAFAYFKTAAGGKLVIGGANFCPGSSGNSDASQSGEAFANDGSKPWNEDVTKYVVQGSTQGTYYGKIRKSSSSSCNDPINVTINNPVFQAATGLYRARITVSHKDKYSGRYDGILNAFRLSITGSGAYVIAQGADTDRGYDVTVNQGDSSPSHLDYYVKFGSDCTVNSDRSERLYFYDLDNDGGSGAQLGGKITMRLYEQTVGGSGLGRNIKFNNHSNGTFRDSSKQWVPGNSNNATEWVSFTASPDMRYQLRMYNVYYNNTIQFSTPFDGVYFNTGCQIPDPTYRLTPKVVTDPSDTAQQNSDIKVSPVITKSGSASTGVLNWSVSLIKVAGGASLPSKLSDGLGQACARYATSGFPDCSRINNGSSAFPNNNLPSSLVSATDPPGTRYCFVTSVNKPTDVSSVLTLRHSEVECVTIQDGLKSPKIQVLGNDIRVRGKVATNTTFESPKTFGSWVEYGVFSTGVNEAFGSGAGLRNGSVIPAQSDWSDLTFANSKEPEVGELYGEYSLPETPKIAEYFDKLPGDTCGSPLSNGVHSCGDVTLTGRAGIDGTVVIKSSGTVTISGNITYGKGPYASVGQLPQVVIIADNIVINENVAQVDAWLITRDGGSIKTCGARDVNDPQLTKATCATKLTVNGPVITDQLYLHRTHGSDGATDASRSEPAEVFNLRPDTYLWAYQYGLTRSQPITGSVTELPPRF